MLLRDILIESKSYWGYSYEQLETWRAKLKFESEYIARNTVKLIIKDAKTIGFYALIKRENKGEVDELDHLWLLPEAIGLGIGNIVYKEIVKDCKRIGIKEFYIISDPDAQGFYLKKGAVLVGEVFSDAQQRMLPKLKYQLI